MGRTFMDDVAGVAQTVGEVLDDAIDTAREAARPDLVQRLAVAKARAVRPGTVVVVVGEFKQGKSSLVNALVGADVCPVDDDLATSVVTVVHHAEAPVAIARRRTEDGLVVEEVPLAEVRAHVTEDGNPGNERALERLDLGTPAPLLHDGLVVVDTPGMGGLGAGQAASTLGFLPYADALLFVTDASQELTAPELDLLLHAVDVCPVVVTCLTKVDLHPAWRQVLELDRAHLVAAEVATPVVPVSATVHGVAGERHDPALDEESGVPHLVTVLQDEVVGRARARATAAACGHVLAVVDQLDAAAASELAALTDLGRARRLAAEVEAVQGRLEQLRGPGARWSTLLGDRITDLGQRTTHDLRRAVRDLARELESDVDELRTDEDWQQLARHLQARTAEVVAALFAGVEQAGADLRSELVALFDEEELVLPGTGRVGAGLDVDDLLALPVEAEGDRMATRLGAGLAALRQAQSGVVMFGMLGRLLPAAATTLLASNPIMLGAGVLLGGRALVDQRRRQVTERRHDARRAVRQFLDDLQFELSPVLADAVRDLHRTLRDGVTATVAERQRTWTEAGQRARAALVATETARAEQVPLLEARRTRLAALRDAATRLGTA